MRFLASILDYFSTAIWPHSVLAAIFLPPTQFLSRERMFSVRLTLSPAGPVALRAFLLGVLAALFRFGAFANGPP